MYSVITLQMQCKLVLNNLYHLKLRGSDYFLARFSGYTVIYISNESSNDVTSSLLSSVGSVLKLCC